MRSLNKDLEFFKRECSRLEATTTAQEEKIREQEGLISNLEIQHQRSEAQYQRSEAGLKKEIESLKEQLEEARREGIKEYRLSQNCYNRKEKLSFPFLRCGFYAARAYLEDKRKESFPELEFYDDFFQFSVPDLRSYDPGRPSLKDELFEAQQDDLEDLDEPLTPYVPPQVEVPPSPLLERFSTVPPNVPPNVSQGSFPEGPSSTQPELDPEDTIPLSIIIPSGGPTIAPAPPAASTIPVVHPSPDSAEDTAEMIEAVVDLERFDDVE